MAKGQGNNIPHKINEQDVYTKTYTMRRQGEEGLNTVVTIPPLVIEKEARKRGLTPDEFVRTFKAVATFNGFEGVLYRFVKMDAKEAEQIPEPTEPEPVTSTE